LSTREETFHKQNKKIQHNQEKRSQGEEEKERWGREEKGGKDEYLRFKEV
jgi:hypothetical protein